MERLDFESVETICLVTVALFSCACIAVISKCVVGSLRSLQEYWNKAVTKHLNLLDSLIKRSYETQRLTNYWIDAVSEAVKRRDFTKDKK